MDKEKKNTLVLVVEDYLVNQELTKELLEMMSCTVDVADSGKEALNLVGKNKYDLIFMDIQMPKMDGYETTRQIRRIEGDKRHTPIVALTANALQGDREKCLSAGMDDYISKPFRGSDLEAIIMRWVQGKDI
jgi:CheY-like chemotaxis protein